MENLVSIVKAMGAQLGCVEREREINGAKVTSFIKRLKNDGGPPTVVDLFRLVEKGDKCEVHLLVLVPADDDVISYGFQHVRGEGVLIEGNLSEGKVKFTKTPDGTAYIDGDVVPFKRKNNEDVLPTVGA